jgi:hypothetical protein
MNNPAALRKALLVFFGILVIPWFPFALLGGMAMDAWPRHKTEVVWFLVGVYSYPLMYAVGWFASKWKPWLALLPAFSIAAFLLSSAFD